MKKWMYLSVLLYSWTFLSFADINNLSDKADKYNGKFDYVILSDVTDVKVQESGMNIRTEKVSVKVLSFKGCREFHTVSFFYDPLTMIMKVIGAEVVKSDGTVKKIDLNTVKIYPNPARAIYWPNKRISIPFGLLDTGDVITYELEKKGFSYALLADEAEDSRFAPPMKGHFYDIVSFQSFNPILKKVYSIELPGDKPIQYRFFHGEVMPRSEFTDYGMKYVFEKTDIEGAVREPSMVDISDFGYKLLVSTTVKWEDKSEWFYSVNEDFSFKVIPEVQAKVNELVAHCDTDEEKIDVLNHWVAHYIRYSGLTMGEGEGFTLHPSDMIMRDRTGVCKDKASLLITFLRAAGFEAYPAMTMAGSRIENFPADHFNHCVVALREDDGNFRMLDPTWVPWVREQWSSAEQEQQYLIGYKDGQTLMTTPYSPPENHFYKINSTCEIDKNGTLKARFIIDLEGQVDSRIRRYLQRNHPKEADAYFKRLLYHLWGHVDISDISYNDPWNINRHITVTLVFAIQNYCLTGDDFQNFQSPVLTYAFNDSLNSELKFSFSEKERQTGIRTRCTKLMDLKETISFPRKTDLKNSEALKSFSYSGEYAAMKLSSDFSDKRLETRVIMNLNKRIYPVEAYDDLKQVIGGFQNAAEQYVKIKQKGGEK